MPHAGAFPGSAPNDGCLCVKQLIDLWQIRLVKRGRVPGKEIVQHWLFQRLFVPGDVLRGIAAFLCGHSDQIGIVVSEAQLFGQQFPDFASAAAIFAGDRDD